MSDILPLADAAVSLATAGGKGVNLAILARAGLPVPPGFIVGTGAYRAFVAANGLQGVIEAALTGLEAQDPAALEAASAHIQAAFAAGELEGGLRAEVATAYGQLGETAVAVRSSATAEDLPDLSFAGQQDTYLNVVGLDNLSVAIIRCWASLWTARAIGYRARNAIDQHDVALAVVVQQMAGVGGAGVDASGVLFTADPLTGRRTWTAIDATLGLGEALVSGQVEPDHYLVDMAGSAQIVRKTLGAKATVIVGQAGGGTVTLNADNAARQALPDATILELAALGQRVQALYRGVPQDIEWAWAGGKLVLLQARAITSLYPLPANMAAAPLEVMFAFSSVQGIFEPLTPLGQDVLKYLLSGAGQALGFNLDPATQRLVFSAGERLYIRITPVLRTQLGRELGPRIFGALDPGVALALAEVVQDPRLRPGGALQSAAAAGIARFAGPALWRVRAALADPAGARTQVVALMEQEVARANAAVASTGDLWGDLGRQVALLGTTRNLFADTVLPQMLPAVVAGMAMFFGVLQRFAGQAAQASGRPELAQLPLQIARSLPYNVTTEMDLALWQVAQVIRADPASAAQFEGEAGALAAAYLAGQLPIPAQAALAAFMDRYGMRGPGEIDIGRPRWREQPEPLMQTLQSYLAIEDPARAPSAVFAAGAQAAAQAVDALVAAVGNTPGGAGKARLVRWAAGRYRGLAGLREFPKYFMIRMLGVMRRRVLESGAALTAQGELTQADDLFYLTIAELKRVVAARAVGDALRAEIATRRAVRARELRRRQVPRVLLSDGTAYYAGVQATGDDANTLAGEAVSPGVAEGVVHIVFQPNGVQLAPGEILVCPGTDPAWTPLFLAAGGLVMEVGGMMTHGSVVAREYGIPAVVGVHEATTRLRDGQRVRVDGGSGTVTILETPN